MALPRPPLNLQPLGLLDHFAIKNGGEYPQDLVPTLQPTLDLGQWYAESNAVETNLTRATIIVNTASSLIPFTASTPLSLPLDATGSIAVPDTEVWFVTDFSCRWQWDAVAGGTIHGGVSMAVIVQATTNIVRALPTLQNGALNSSASVVTGGTCAIVRPTYMLPRDRLGVYTGGIIAGGAVLSIVAELRFRRFRI